jgi:Fe-Mn family superoxide dismutase
MMTRREALKTGSFLLAAVGISPRTLAQSVIDGRFQPQFSLPALPYPIDSLGPNIDTLTLQIHHDFIQAAYVDELNSVVSSIPDFYFDIKTKGTEEQKLEYILGNAGSIPSSIRAAALDNAGGHYNHSLFWRMMKKNGGGEPGGAFVAALERDFGSYGGFKQNFTKAAIGLFGSGWAWVTIEAGKMKIEVTANEDTPLTAGRPVLLGIDVWEHSYYLQYRNRRADYVAAWWNVVNWDFVADRFSRLKG